MTSRRPRCGHIPTLMQHQTFQRVNFSSQSVSSLRHVMHFVQHGLFHMQRRPHLAMCGILPKSKLNTGEGAQHQEVLHVRFEAASFGGTSIQRRLKTIYEVNIRTHTELKQKLGTAVDLVPGVVAKACLHIVQSATPGVHDNAFVRAGCPMHCSQ
eukprot:502394-Amphidinium_carterae.1